MAEAQKNLPFEFEGRRYVFDWQMTVKDAIFLKEKAHVSGADLFAYLDRRDPETVAAFMMIAKQKNREAVTWNDMLESNVFSFKWLPVDGEEESSAPGDKPGEGSAEEGPTESGKTQKGGTSKTAKP